MMGDWERLWLDDEDEDYLYVTSHFSSFLSFYFYRSLDSVIQGAAEILIW